MTKLCALDSVDCTEQYVQMAGDSVFCLHCVAYLLISTLEGGYLEGKRITTLEEFWAAVEVANFSSIGY
jgi:hypothetical protein